MSGYPASESIRAKEPRAPVNYPPVPPPRSVRKPQAPPSTSKDKAPPPTRQGVPIEDDSEIEMNDPTQFRYAPAPAFRGREDSRDQPPLRRRAGSRAPVDMASTQEGREDESGLESNGEQAGRQAPKK
jgi:hypothetical protein